MQKEQTQTLWWRQDTYHYSCFQLLTVSGIFQLRLVKGTTKARHYSEGAGGGRIFFGAVLNSKKSRSATSPRRFRDPSYIIRQGQKSKFFNNLATEISVDCKISTEFLLN